MCVLSPLGCYVLCCGLCLSACWCREFVSALCELRPFHADSFDVCVPVAPVGGCLDGSTISGYGMQILWLIIFCAVIYVTWDQRPHGLQRSSSRLAMMAINIPVAAKR